MQVIPYSATPSYITTVTDNDVFVLEQNGSGFSGMKKITVGDFLRPVYDTIYQIISPIYKFMGSVSTYEDLPVYAESQDPVPVYGILSGEERGKNYAWIDDHWELFGTQVNLTEYITETDLQNILLEYTKTGHKHRAADIEDLSVVQSLTLVESSSEDGGLNVFSIENTDGSSQRFSIKNGKSGTNAVNYRVDGAGSITRNADGSYSPEYLYLQLQKLTDTIDSYPGRILISSQQNDDWVTVYPSVSTDWTDERFVQFYIPADVRSLRIRLYPTGTDYSQISDDKILYEEHVSVAQTGPRGFSVKDVKLEADSYVFKADENGSIQEPSEINFKVYLQNTTGSPLWTAAYGDVLVKSGTGETFSINIREMGDYGSLTISVVCDGISDTCTIVKLSEGADGTSPRHVICDNESFVIPTGADKVTTTRYETDVTFRGYVGTEESPCTVLNVANVPKGMAYSVDEDCVHFTIPLSVQFSADFGLITVILECGGSRIMKMVSWSLSKGGVSAKSISIEADSYIFKADDTGTIQSPDRILFSATLQNLDSVPIWYAKHGTETIKTGTGAGFVLTASEMGSYTNVKVTTSCEGYTDSCTIMVLSNGLSGYSTTQLRLFKRASSVPAAYAGDRVTYYFATGAYDFGPQGSDGWSSEITAGEGDLYVIYASAHSKLATDTIEANEWSSPVILSEESVMGQSGYSVATVFIYCRSAQTPAVPYDPVTYRFDGGEMTGLESPWSKTIPTGPQNLWVSQATAFSRTESDVIESSEWSAPAIISANGREAYNNAQLFLYKRGYSLPSAYAGGVVTYDFTNATFSFGDGGADGWSPVPVTANGNIYVICFSASSVEDTVQVQPAQWTAPQLYVMEPANGAHGYSSATVFIYTRSASQPSVPSEDVTYIFNTGDMTGLPVNWFKSPPAGEIDLWISQANVVSDTGSAIISTDRWSVPVIFTSNGDNGSPGWSSTQVLLFKRSSQVPAVYDGTSATYHFSTGEIFFAGSSDGWSPEPPNGTDDLYVIRAAATSQTDTDVIAANEWSEPILYVAKAADGRPGENGYNVATVIIYKRSETIPDLPNEDITYEFSTGYIQGLTKGWSATMPSGSDQLWVSQATAFSRSTVDTIESSQWSYPPTVMVKNGEDGSNGYSIGCSNETFSISTDGDGRVIETFQTQVPFYGYSGTEEKTVTLSDVSGVPFGMSVVIDHNVLLITVLQNVKIPANYGVISVIVTCDDVRVTKFVTWSKAKSGSDGRSGTRWYQGTILIGETTCTGVAGELNDCYLNTETCNVYICITAGDAESAVWQFDTNIKGDKGDQGDDGQSFTVVIESSNGSTFRMNDVVDTVLSCKVYFNTQEVTDDLESWRFNWKRISGNPIEDQIWNRSQKAQGSRTVHILNEDVYGRSVFICEVEID